MKIFKAVFLVSFTTLTLQLNFALATGDPSVSFILSNYAGYNISCYGGSDGTISAVITDGSPPYHYLWSNSQTSASIEGLSAGNYIFKLYNSANTLVLTDTVELNEPDSLYAVLVPTTYGSYNISRKGGNDGSIDAQFHGGVPPYEYWWEPNGISFLPITELSAGDHALIYLDANQCMDTVTISLTEPDSLIITSVVDSSVTCYGGNNGKIDITVTGGIQPYTYSWTASDYHTVPGNTNQDIANQIAGTYTVVVHSAYGSATKSATKTITQGAPIQISSTKSQYPNGFNVSCFSCYDGSISTSISSGGQSPFSYLWAGGQTSSTINSVGDGIFYVTVTDAHSCTATKIDTLRKEGNEWKKTGDSLTTDTTKFLGSLDAAPLIFKTQNTERLRVKPNGDINIPQFAGNDPRILMIDGTGTLYPGGDVPDGETPINCYSSNPPPSSPWYRTTILGPNGGYDNFNCNNRFGFGLSNPQERIHVNGLQRFSANTGVSANYLNIGFNSVSKINSYGTDLFINDDSHKNIKLCSNGGTVSIGATTPIGTEPHKLYVRGGIRTEAIRVDVASANLWSDFVFDKNYKMKDLLEVENFILANKHLPGIPSANDVVTNGIDLVEIDSKLLSKIEELTLYIIELKKEVEALKLANNKKLK